MSALFDPHPILPRRWSAWRALRGLAAAFVLAGLVVGVPWALVRFTDWPITSLPTWEQLADLPTSATSEAAIVGVFVVALWAGWALFAACVALEIAAQVRGSDAMRMPGFGPLQHTARVLVTSVVMTVGSLGTFGSQRAIAAPADGSSVITHMAATTPVAAPRLARPAPPTGVGATDSVAWRWITATDRDTAWTLAEHHYGDGTEAHRLWQDNRDHLQPDGSRWSNEADPIEPGWRLRISRGSTNDSPPGGEETVTVQPGDSLWTIAENRLTDHLHREPASGETAPYWQATVDTNRERLTSGDPDLIYPHEVIVLPTLPSTTEARTPTRPPNRPAPPPEPSPDSPEPPSEAASSPTSTTSSTSSTTTASAGRPSLPPTSDTHPPTSTGTTGTADDLSEPEDRTEIVVGVSEGLGALTLAALARRRLSRRKSARPGTSAGPRPATDIDTERTLAIAAGDALGRAWQTARALGATLLTMPDPSTVTGLVVRSDGTVVVHLADTLTPSPPFVENPADTTTWVLPAEHADPDETEETPPALETLVALGRTATGDWVFVDLESLGALSIEGHRDTGRRLLRSLLAELALQPLRHYVDITVAGEIEAPDITEQGVVAIERLDESVSREFERLAAETGDLLAAEEVASTFVARAHGVPRDGLVVSVVVVADDANDPVLLSRLAEAAAPGGRGIAIVTLDPLGPDTPHLIASEDGTAHVPHLGLAVHVAGLDMDGLSRVDDLLRHEPDTADDITEPHVAVLNPLDPDEPVEPYEAPQWTYCIRVFSDLLVEDNEGNSLSFRYGTNPDVPNKNTNRGPELLAYLALRPDRSANLDEVGDHMWWRRPISARSVETLVAGTRKVLGGRDHLSVAEGDPARRRFRLATTVTTDVELLDHALGYARSIARPAPDVAVATLRSHLARIEVSAFRRDHLGGGLAEWAAAYRIVDRVEQPVIEAGLLAAELAAGQGPHGIVDALWALDQALRACELNEALIRAAMTIEARLGHREAAQRRYLALATRLAVDDLEPEDETTELRAEIMNPNYRIG